MTRRDWLVGSLIGTVLLAFAVPLAFALLLEVPSERRLTIGIGAMAAIGAFILAPLAGAVAFALLGRTGGRDDDGDPG